MRNREGAPPQVGLLLLFLNIFAAVKRDHCRKNIFKTKLVNRVVVIKANTLQEILGKTHIKVMCRTAVKSVIHFIFSLLKIFCVCFLVVFLVNRNRSRNLLYIIGEAFKRGQLADDEIRATLNGISISSIHFIFSFYV